MCEEWRVSFERFYADMGPRPSKQHSLDRIDNDGPYAPGNCRWADNITQHRNTRRSAMVCFNGETRTIAEWAERLKIGHNTIRQRLAMGWSTERALSVKPSYRRILTVNGESRSLTEWASIAGLTHASIHARLERGWSHERAVLTPNQARNRIASQSA